MLPIAKSVRTLTGLDSRALPDDVLLSTQPLVLKSLVSHWPMVQAAQQSPSAAAQYLRSFYRGAIVEAFFGAPQFGGRFFYNDDLTGFNFHPERLKLDAVLDEIDRFARDAQPPGIYVGSTTVETCLPGFRDQNDVDLGDRDALASVWIGNRTRIAAHYDAPDNIACVAAGHRRFTLFPPEALENLYVGPLDLTPAGQPISLVGFANPDLQKFPNFPQALQCAQVAEMEPGDEQRSRTRTRARGRLGKGTRPWPAPRGRRRRDARGNLWARPSVLKITESKMLLSLQFVLVSRWFHNRCGTGDKE